MKRAWIALAVLAGVFLAYHGLILASTRASTNTVFRLEGGEVALEDLPRPVAVNFFAPWCPPCRREIPLLLQRADVVFVGVEDFKPRVVQFARELGIPPHRLFYGGFGGPTRFYNVQALPTTFVFCPGTTPPKRVVGEITPERLPELSCP